MRCSAMDGAPKTHRRPAPECVPFPLRCTRRGAVTLQHVDPSLLTRPAFSIYLNRWLALRRKPSRWASGPSSVVSALIDQGMPASEIRRGPPCALPSRLRSPRVRCWDCFQKKRDRRARRISNAIAVLRVPPPSGLILRMCLRISPPHVSLKISDNTIGWGSDGRQEYQV
jgi:hypothetical protein